MLRALVAACIGKSICEWLACTFVHAYAVYIVVHTFDPTYKSALTYICAYYRIPSPCIPASTHVWVILLSIHARIYIHTIVFYLHTQQVLEVERYFFGNRESWKTSQKMELFMGRVKGTSRLTITISRGTVTFVCWEFFFFSRYSTSQTRLDSPGTENPEKGSRFQANNKV